MAVSRHGGKGLQPCINLPTKPRTRTRKRRNNQPKKKHSPRRKASLSWYLRSCTG